MTDVQYKEIIDACKPTPVMYLAGGFNSPQDNANYAWKKIANELGFVWDTVKPNGKGKLCFSAEEKK